MNRFNRYEEDRMYIGFTEVELDGILTALEKLLPADKIIRRIEDLVIAFRKQKEKEGNGKNI